MLVPTVGPFFTRLPLEAAFKYQDRKRYMSSRRYVAPSFNDVRLVLNSAQIMAVTNGALQLATFDGDVTLYDDGQSLEPSSPLIPPLLGTQHSFFIGLHLHLLFDLSFFLLPIVWGEERGNVHNKYELDCLHGP